MTNDEIVSLIVDRLKEAHRQVIQLTVLHSINEAGIFAILAMMQERDLSHEPTAAPTDPIGVVFHKLRKKYIEDHLIEFENQNPALAAAIQAWLDDETKGLKYGD
jgi:hypothetical protein